MKRRTALGYPCVALFAFACRAKRSSPHIASSATPSRSVAALGRIGGSLMRGEWSTLELALFEDGLIEAALNDEDGHALNEPAEVNATLSTRGGATVQAPLTYVARRQRFQGQVEARGELVSGPCQIEIVHNQRRDTLRFERVVVLRGPKLGGHMLSVADFGVELIPEATGRVRAWAHDARGNAVRDASLAFDARLLSTSLARQSIRLGWDAAAGCYVGEARAPLRPGPLEIGVARQGSNFSRIQQAALAPQPLHGGRVVLVGFHAVEIVSQRSELVAFVYDAFGKPYAASHLELMLSLGVPPKALVYRLLWDEPRACYRMDAGSADATNLPLRISLRAGERIDWGGAAAR